MRSVTPSVCMHATHARLACMQPPHQPDIIPEGKPLLLTLLPSALHTQQLLLQLLLRLLCGCSMISSRSQTEDQKLLLVLVLLLQQQV